MFYSPLCVEVIGFSHANGSKSALVAEVRCVRLDALGVRECVRRRVLECRSETLIDIRFFYQVINLHTVHEWYHVPDVTKASVQYRVRLFGKQRACRVVESDHCRSVDELHGHVAHRV